MLAYQKLYLLSFLLVTTFPEKVETRIPKEQTFEMTRRINCRSRSRDSNRGTPVSKADDFDH